ncbi:unnamed protein product [Urochloa decumbens]|uniref:F-box domain-containing protein n=1 Tax=Urochloa decumbens TaxID=240449 RepID=A0ABC9BZE0_9POAL
MLPGKRTLLQSTAPHTSTSTVARNSGWLSVRRDRPSNFKRPRRADEGDGSPLPDEILLGIFAGIIEIADLVRCAATCRRWRRLVSGEAAFIHTLPPLTGKDGVGHYACTVLTADDRHGENGGTDSPRSASSYRLLLVYSRRDFTAFRSYSSSDDDGGGWSPEAKVTGARLGKQQMGLMRNGVVAPGGRVAYWLAKDAVFALRLDTMEASVLAKRRVHIDSTRLGFTPEGNLCTVKLDRAMNKATHRWSVRVLCISTNGLHSGDYDRHERWQKEYDIWIESFSLDNGATLKLRWFCERSGVVLFTTDHWIGGGRISEVYAFSIPTRTLEKVMASNNNGDGNGGGPWENFYGYEIDQAAYLSSLAEPGRMMEDI